MRVVDEQQGGTDAAAAIVMQRDQGDSADERVVAEVRIPLETARSIVVVLERKVCCVSVQTREEKSREKSIVKG